MGTLLLILGIVLVLAALSYGLYSRRGSGIPQRPIDDRDGSPGAEGAGGFRDQEARDRLMDQHGER